MPVEYTLTDLVERARAILTNAGLELEAVDVSGELVTCGTIKKPNGTDGRYAVHLDWPPNVWLCNYHEGGEGRTVPLYDRGALDAMTVEEMEAMRERIRQEKEVAQARREEERRASAEEANRIFPTLPKAGEDNPYLKRKGCVPLGDMRECDAEQTPFPGLFSGRCLVLPVRNADGRIVSLQFVDSKGNKRFQPGGEKKACYFPIPAKDGSQDGPLLVGEGCATVASACMATGYAGLVAFDSGNLEAVARMARKKYAKREIVLLADNDCTDKDGNPRPDDKNPGLVAATNAAQAVGGKLAVCPAIRGRKADFNDLFTDSEEGPERVRVVVENAREGKTQTLPGEWAAPVPFTAHTLPKLDATNLPPVLGDFCAGLAEEKQVPVEIAVAMALATLATAVQGRYVVRIREGYTEPLNIYTLCPLEPANRKSATVEACTAPLKEWEKWMADSMAPEVKAARSKRLTMEKTIEAKRNKATKCTTVQEIDELQKEILALEEQLPKIPVIPRLLADNTTPEALAVLMENMGGCIAIITAEGGIFDILAGMYNKGTPNLDLFLKGHSGDSFRVDRRMAPPVLLDNPRLTLGISPQPITLAERSASKVFRGRGLDGRFLYFMPESLLGRRKLEPSPMSPAVKSRFHDKVRGLLPLRWCPDMPEPVELELSPEAYQIWLALAGEVEKGLAPGGEFEGLNDWGGKLAGAVARIAGLFHLITHDRPEELKITPETMRQAAYMGALLIEHAKAAYALMGTDETIEGAKKVLEWIRRQAAERFTVRDCFNGVRSATLFPHVEAVKAALKELEEREFIRELPAESKGPGRKPSPMFLVNPATLRG